MKQKEKLKNSYNIARYYILTVAIITLANLVLLLIKYDTYLPFSSMVAWLSGFYGNIYTVKTGLATYYIIGVIISVVIIGILSLCYVLSKKKNGWLIAAIAIYALDTLVFLWIYLITGTKLNIDLIARCLAFYYIIKGVNASIKIKM